MPPAEPPTRRQRLTMTSVRRATPEDLPALAVVEAAANARLAAPSDAPRWATTPCGPPRPWQPDLLLAVGHPTAGFAHVAELVHRGRSYAHLERLRVHPAARGLGLNAMLLRAALGEALDRGHERITVRVRSDPPGPAAWYAKHGFTELVDDLPDRLVPPPRAERDPAPEPAGRGVVMSRPLADEPVPRAAVSVIPLRDGPAGLEAFVQYRAATMDFVPGAVVFPGGRIDPQDEAAGGRLTLPGALVADRLARLPHVARHGSAALRTLLATGVRELAEETGAKVAAHRLVPWDNWVTPIGSPRRFDVVFFVLPVDGDDLRHTTTEATRSRWLALDELVGQAEAGRLVLVPPTRTIVDELQALGSVSAVLALRPTVRPVRHDLTTRRPRPAGPT